MASAAPTRPTCRPAPGRPRRKAEPLRAPPDRADSPLQVTTTLPDRAAAERLGAALVEERLAACAQVTGPVTSIYRWAGAVETATEWYCHLKTMPDRLPALEARIAELHPYRVPEIIALPIAAGSPAYLAWIAAETRPAPSEEHRR